MNLNLFVLPVTILLVIGILALSIYFARRLASKLSSPKLQVAEGKVRLEEDYGQDSGGIFYLVYVGRKKFSFADSLCSRKVEGILYIIARRRFWNLFCPWSECKAK